MLSRNAFHGLCSARDLLRVACEQRPTIEFAARAAAMSPYHFIRQFEALFGETPHQFRIRTQIESAKQLLASGGYPVTDVCLEVGFTSLGSFSDLFARRVGVPPSVYRRRARAMIQSAGHVPDVLSPGCLTLMGHLPADSAICEKRPHLSVSHTC